MSRILIISDTHFYHKNICVFTDANGKKVRPWTDAHQMTEEMIVKWNNVVQPEDVVYHLGDVCFRSANHLAVMDRLNGTKHLILGNHDHYEMAEYRKYFQTISGSLKIGEWGLTHIPVHETQLDRIKVNVHGHIHEKDIKDGRYYNVSVENLDYQPITLEELEQRIKLKQRHFP